MPHTLSLTHTRSLHCSSWLISCMFCSFWTPLAHSHPPSLPSPHLSGAFVLVKWFIVAKLSLLKINDVIIKCVFAAFIVIWFTRRHHDTSSSSSPGACHAHTTHKHTARHTHFDILARKFMNCTKYAQFNSIQFNLHNLISVCIVRRQSNEPNWTMDRQKDRQKQRQTSSVKWTTTDKETNSERERERMEREDTQVNKEILAD